MTIAVTHSTVATLPDEPGAEINKAQWNANHSLTGVADIAQGGTGAGDAATARTNLGVPSGSGTSTGTNTGDQTITLTGAVTGSGTGSFATTLTGPYSATTFTTGALLIGKGTSAIQTDATKLFWDVTNHGLSIGANTLPASTDKLYVNGDAVLGGMRFSTPSGAFIQNVASNQDLNIQTKDVVSGSAGNFSLFGGATAAAAGLGGSFSLVGGDANGAGGTAGSLFITSGAGNGANANGGDLYIVGGIGSGTGLGGNVSFYPGSGGTNGSISFGDSAGNTVLQIGPAANELRFGTYTAGVLAPTGYITIKDLGGTTRRLLVG